MAFTKTIDEAWDTHLDQDSKTEEDEIGEEIVDYLNKNLYLGQSDTNPDKAKYVGEGVITFAGYAIEVGGYDERPSDPPEEEQEMMGGKRQKNPGEVGEAAAIARQFATDDEVNKVRKSGTTTLNKMERKIRDVGNRL